MSFLKKTKKEDEINEEELDELPKKRLSKKPKDKDFKDLSPENKKKRKEPKKPWGRKERVILAIILFLTAGVSGFLSLSSRDFKLPGVPRIKIPSFNNLSLFGEETLVIEGDNNMQQKANKIVENFKSETKNLSGIYGLYVYQFDSGFSFGIYEDETFEAASLIKLPVMLTFYLEEEKGNLRLETKYKLKQTDKRSGAGFLASKPVGYEVTYRDLVKYMGKNSDNTAYAASKNILSEEKIINTLDFLEMKSTSLEKNTTTPSGIGNFYKKLWVDGIINDKNKDELLNYLTDTDFEKWLSAGVSGGTKLAHKYGREVHVVNDAGIVFTQKPYVVVIMSKGVVDAEADKVFPKLSEIVFKGLTTF